MKLSLSILIVQALCIFPLVLADNSILYRDYIGALFKNITFSDVPIYANTQFHFILSFAIDYTTRTLPPQPTNGIFHVFWDSHNLTPKDVLFIKKFHPNVKLALSIGGDSVNNHPVGFLPTTVDSWVYNAVKSLTEIIQKYHLDGIDIDYEHFKNKSDTRKFTACIGGLIRTLKRNKVISFASIAPFDDEEVQHHYKALWRIYGMKYIDYVNFQFYAYDDSITANQFVDYYKIQTSNYEGAKVLVSFLSEKNGTEVSPKNFFIACKKLKKKEQLYGIFSWCADSNKAGGFINEIKSQNLLVQN